MNKIEVIDATTPVELGVADDVIGELRTRLTGRKADTHAGYEMVRAGIAEVTKYRTGVGRAGKELKASAIAFQKKVNVEVSRVTELLLEIEMPLREEKDRVDKEARRLVQEREEGERIAIENKERAEREAVEAEEESKREEERKEREAAEVKLSEQRKELEADRERHETEQRWQQEQFEKERQDLAAEREKIQADKLAIIEKARVARDAREAVEREEAAAAEAAEQKVRDEQDRELANAAEEVRLAEEKTERDRIAEEQLPDREKLKDFARRIGAVEPPRLGTVFGNGVCSEMCRLIQSARDLAYHVGQEAPF